MAIAPTAVQPQIAGSIEAMARFASAYHAAIGELHAANRSINDQMSTMLMSATGPLTPAQNAELDDLSAARKKINRTISEYAMIHNMVLNQSGDVASLIGAAASINKGLKLALQQQQAVLAAIKNFNGMLQALTSFVGALASVAAVLA